MDPQQRKSVAKRRKTKKSVKIRNSKYYQEEKALKSEKSLKSDTKLLRVATNDIYEVRARSYELEIEKNGRIPRNIQNLVNASPLIRKKYEAKIREIKIIDCLLCLFSLISIVFSVLDNDLISINYNLLTDKFIVTSFNNVARSFVILSNIISVYLIIRRYSIKLEMHKLKLGKIANEDNLITTKLIYKMMIEILINSIFNPPEVDHQFYMNGSIFVKYDYSKILNIKDESNLMTDEVSVKLCYNISAIITFIILFRIYHLIRLIHTFSFWNSIQARNTCQNLTCKADLKFGIRADLKMKPFSSLLICVVFAVIFFALSEKITEYYNKQLIDALDDKEISRYHVKIMRKFESFYNSLWLIVVTMTTIGYGDIYPTTYFGRILAIFACIFGTFLVSMLVVFINSTISFDEVEKHVFNQIVEEKFSMKIIRKEAVKLIYKALEYNYLRKKMPKDTALYRFKLLYIDLRHMTRQFKAKRIVNLKTEVDIDDILGEIKYNLDFHVSPFRNILDEYNKERLIFDHSYNYLRDSSNLSDSFAKNSMQIINLLRIMNNGKYLNGLTSINEVYDSKVNFVEEVLNYHKIKDKLEKIDNHSVDSKEDVTLTEIDTEEEDSQEESQEESQDFSNE